MLRSVKELKKFKLLAEGDQFGDVTDVYIDSEVWTVRYLVVETGSWLNSREVLLPPQELGLPDWDNRLFRTSLTKDQIRDSPPVDTHKPISRDYENSLYNYWGWRPYWTGLGAMGTMGPPVPAGIARSSHADPAVATETDPAVDPNLRSGSEVLGYNIRAQDDEIGHAEDFLFDDASGWNIRYMVVDTRNFLPGRKVLVSVDWIADILWDRMQVAVDLSTDDIRNSPEWDPSAPPTRQYESSLHSHYRRRGYWNR